MAVTLSLDQFLSDRHGACFVDVVRDRRIRFQKWLDFFNHPDRQDQMVACARDPQRSALSGVVQELETLGEFHDFFSGYDCHTTRRGRQAIGVIIRIIMEELGWTKTGRKEILGRRTRVRARTTTPGAYYNATGISKWFTRAERYLPPV